MAKARKKVEQEEAAKQNPLNALSEDELRQYLHERGIVVSSASSATSRVVSSDVADGASRSSEGDEYDSDISYEMAEQAECHAVLASEREKIEAITNEQDDKFLAFQAKKEEDSRKAKEKAFTQFQDAVTGALTTGYQALLDSEDRQRTTSVGQGYDVFQHSKNARLSAHTPLVNNTCARLDDSKNNVALIRSAKKSSRKNRSRGEGFRTISIHHDVCDDASALSFGSSTFDETSTDFFGYGKTRPRDDEKTAYSVARPRDDETTVASMARPRDDEKTVDSIDKASLGSDYLTASNGEGAKKPAASSASKNKFPTNASVSIASAKSKVPTATSSTASASNASAKKKTPRTTRKPPPAPCREPSQRLKDKKLREEKEAEERRARDEELNYYGNYD